MAHLLTSLPAYSEVHNRTCEVEIGLATVGMTSEEVQHGLKGGRKLRFYTKEERNTVDVSPSCAALLW